MSHLASSEIYFQSSHAKKEISDFKLKLHEEEVALRLRFERQIARLVEASRRFVTKNI
jgi:hypothetical protein